MSLDSSLDSQIENWLIKRNRFSCENVPQTQLLPLLNLQKQQVQHQPHHIIATENIDQFIIEFLAAVSLEIPVFLTDPRWGEVEQQQFAELIALGTSLPGTIMIPTGGTSGQLKLAIHSPVTLSAAVQGFQEFYGVAEINSHCLLPLHHVSGLMQLWRSITTNGHFTTNQEVSGQAVPGSFISLVPTQLQRWLHRRSDWLRSFKTVIIGGAPAAVNLLAEARAAQIPLSLSYGATETAAMVTALPVADFLAGAVGCGHCLPHVDLRIQPDTGRIEIKSPSLMLGYYPNLRAPQEYWLTDDLGEFDESRNLQIIGRESQKIISGGEKIFPEQVEAAILATGLVTDVCVLGIPDVEWGDRVVACYVGAVDPLVLQAAVADRLAPFKRPKAWFSLPEIPRNSQGKIDRQRLHQQINPW
jgi:o-succinylbenzoate---CoA ligase